MAGRFRLQGSGGAQGGPEASLVFPESGGLGAGEGRGPEGHPVELVDADQVVAAGSGRVQWVCLLDLAGFVGRERLAVGLFV